MGWNNLWNIIQEWFGPSEGDDYINGDKAVTYAAVKFCVDKISSHIGQLPLNLHKITRDRNEKPTNHLGYRLMRVRPNAYQTPYMFKRQLMTHALLWGNGRAYIWRNGFNVELLPLMPDRCVSMLIDGEKVHFYKPYRDERLELAVDIESELDKASRDGRPPGVIALMDRDVLHWHGLGFDGVQGKSVIEMARRTFNLGVGYGENERNRQKKGYNGGLMLEAPERAFRSEDDAKRFLADFRKNHGGTDAEVIGLLREGIKANVLTMSNKDAEFVESAKMNREDVMMMFSMPTMPGDNASVSYNSLEQKNLSYRIDCLGPWLTIIEEESEAKLLTESEVRNGYYFKFNDGAILRTDKKTTAEICSTLIAARVINPNEGREWFELNPYDGGEVFENPAVSPGRPGQSDDANPEPTTSDGERSARLEAIEHMIGVECQRAVDACKAQNFVDKIDRFYGKWEMTLANKFESLGIDRNLASTYCEESKERLLNVAEVAKTQDELSALVASEVQNWVYRAGHILEESEAVQC